MAMSIDPKATQAIVNPKASNAMTHAGPDILFIAEYLPIGEAFGSRLRVLQTIRLLQRLGHVSLLLVSCYDYDPKQLQGTMEEFDVGGIIKLLPWRLSLGERFRHEFSPSFLKTHLMTAAREDIDKVRQLAARHDAVWILGLQTANALQVSRWPNCVLDIDDVPSLFYASRGRNERNILRKILDYRLSVIWRRREKLLKNRFDVIVVCSGQDKLYLESDPAIHVVNNGFPPIATGHLRVATSPPRLGFIGMFDYMPNRQGIDWFIRDVWPRVKSAVPEARLRLIGRGSDSLFAGTGPDIDGLGWVEDPEKEIGSWSGMIVPILVGGGTRLKIAEGFARKCPMVSTSLGVYGYDVRNGEDLLIADAALDFASCCSSLLTDSALGADLAEKGWKKYNDCWTWDAIEPSVHAAVEACMQAHPGRVKARAS
jgi:hypothetical protein